MRQQRAVLVLLATAAIAACSGMESLSPGPTSDKQGGGSSHGDDTAVVTGPSKTPPPPPDVVSSFALSGVISGHESGPDTTRIVPLANASVTLVKVGEVTGDTLRPSVTVASTTTDAQGTYRLANLAPAYYRVDVTPPADSPYLNAVGGVGPARQTEVKLDIALARKP